jgi:hypothetical protein
MKNEFEVKIDRIDHGHICESVEWLAASSSPMNAIILFMAGTAQLFLHNTARK